jgi:hypothetical protein
MLLAEQLTFLPWRQILQVLEENKMKSFMNCTRVGFSMLAVGALASCSHQSPLPEKENVKVSREKPDEKDCQFLTKVEGRVTTVKGTAEQALEDLKQEAANKGANYLQVEQYSGSGLSVTGMAYKCD